jgi:hypothetical protein
VNVAGDQLLAHQGLRHARVDGYVHVEQLRHVQSVANRIVQRLVTRDDGDAQQSMAG